MLRLPPSILITDDDDSFRETLRDVLEPEGFRTLSAGDGQEALKIVQNEEVHLMLLDMHMPRLTGLETLRIIKRFHNMMPCIILSAEADEETRRKCRQEQAYSVLSKPIGHQELRNIVREALYNTYDLPQDALAKLRPRGVGRQGL